MTEHRYAYRLGWRSLRLVTGRDAQGRWILSEQRAKELARELGQAMVDHRITNRRRACAFIATLLHESGAWRYRAEIESGAAYEGRTDLGNTKSGDGIRFKGRGYIQITGRTNYAAVSTALGQDFVKNPAMLKEHKYAAESAAWWWEAHGCNRAADRGGIKAATKIVNGGYNGMADRRRYYARCLTVAQFLVPRRRKP